MKLFDSIAHTLNRIARKISRRAYESGKVSRLDKDFRGTRATADQDVYEALPQTRDRARDLEQNDGYGKRFIKLCRTNIPGPYGFKFQSNVTEWVQAPEGIQSKPGARSMQDIQGRRWMLAEDELANQKIEDAWNDWSKAENCCVTGDMTFREFTLLMTSHWKRDGEMLARKVYNGSKYGFRLQALEPDLLDETYNLALDNGNKIIMGVEFDRWRKPVAYHLRRESAKSGYTLGYYSMERDRIPASEVYFKFDRDRAFQSRGMSAMAASMLGLKQLKEFEYNSTVNSRIGSGKLGFFYDPDSAIGSEPYTGDGVDGDGNTTLKMRPGSVEDIGQKRFQSWDPQFPHEQHGPFVKSELRRAASGFGVSYNILANDLEGVNYSSLRSGAADEREHWKLDQMLMIEGLMEPIFRDWLMAVLTLQVVKLPLSRFDKFNKPVFTGRTWEGVNPKEDAETEILLQEHGLSTKTDYFASKGMDLEEVNRIISAEKESAKKYGLEFPSGLNTPKLPKPDTNADQGADGNQDTNQGRAITDVVTRILAGNNGNGAH